jgi:hypothetical protein
LLPLPLLLPLGPASPPGAAVGPLDEDEHATAITKAKEEAIPN